MGKSLKWLQWAYARLQAPHEWAHYLAINPWSPDARIHYDVPREDWSHPWIPAAAQVTGSIPPETPLIKIRFGALAPSITMPSIYIILIHLLAIEPLSELFWVVSVPFIYWSLPSGMDLHTATHAERTREIGTFGASASNADWKWDVLAILVAILLGVTMFLYPIIARLFV